MRCPSLYFNGCPACRGPPGGDLLAPYIVCQSCCLIPLLPLSWFEQALLFARPSCSVYCRVVLVPLFLHIHLYLKKHLCRIVFFKPSIALSLCIRPSLSLSLSLPLCLSSPSVILVVPHDICFFPRPSPASVRWLACKFVAFSVGLPSMQHKKQQNIG